MARSKKRRAMNLVYLEWCDAFSRAEAGWLSADDTARWAKETEWVVRQAGFILQENKRYITLVGMYEPGGPNHKSMVSHVQKIPKTWVRKRVNLTSYIG